jgi:hypothetical protein
VSAARTIHAGPVEATKHGWKEQIAQIAPLLDKIHTYLICGYLWHGRAANECRRFRIRGLGRWHEVEARSDACAQADLSKLFMDNLWYAPKTEWDYIKGEGEFLIESLTDF